MYEGVALEGSADAAASTADEDDMDALRNGPVPARPTAKAPTDDIEAQIRGELAEIAEPSAPRFTVLDTDTECRACRC